MNLTGLGWSAPVWWLLQAGKAVKRKWVIPVASSPGSASTLHVITTDSLRKSLTQRVAPRTDTVLAEAGGRYRTVVDRTLAGHLTLD